MLDPREYERLKILYRSLGDERLLDLIRNQARDFPPEAQFLIQAELKSRGYRNEDIAVSESAEEETPPEAAADLESEGWVSVADCPNTLVAGQVQDLLGQNGVPSVAAGSRFGLRPVAGEWALRDERIRISVAPFDADRARKILDGFPPLDEGALIVLDKDGETGEDNDEQDR